MIAHLTVILHSRVRIRHPLTCKEHVSSLLGSQQGWHCNCRLAFDRGRGTKKQKYNKKKKERKKVYLGNGTSKIVKENGNAKRDRYLFSSKWWWAAQAETSEDDDGIGCSTALTGPTVRHHTSKAQVNYGPYWGRIHHWVRELAREMPHIDLAKMYNFLTKNI